uniref:Ribonuclease H1 n=1 Tax=Melanaphis sacchari TaxID=742174 RepID=A0A2H8TCJ3_9HEMI
MYFSGYNYKYRNLLSIKRIFCSFFDMPFYAVIFKSKKAGAIAANWEAARGLRDATPNSFAKKFDTKIEAEKYIKDFKFQIVQNTPSTNDYSKGVKRKRSENSNFPISLVKDHIKKIKMAFSDLLAVSSLTGLSVTSLDQLKNLNNLVIGKLHEILNVNETESVEHLSLVTTINTPSDTFFNEKDFCSPNIDVIDGTDLLPSELESAKKSFTFNEKNEVIVYTDGACSNNGYKGASAGAGVWFGKSHPLNLAIKVPGIQTNNNAEIFSTIKAIERVNSTGLTRISIHTDSDFVIKSVNEWMPRWQANGWKTSAGAEVKNKEMFMVLNKRIQSMDSVSWIYVPGHKGITGNEEADKLARIGAKM